MTRLQKVGAPALGLGVLLALAGSVLVAGTASATSNACPTTNPPNELVVAAGSPQTTQLRKPFATPLQVALANSNGCPLTGQLGGVAIAFAAPASGASGTFAASGSTTITVGTNSQGIATAPAFTANDTAGGYTVSADSSYGEAQLSLTNSASGVFAQIAPTGTSSQQATVNSQYPQPLQAQVLDPNGQPVAGVSVTFTLGAGAYGASASFLGGGNSTSRQTNSDGVAVSPPFVANGAPGRFNAAATAADISTAASYSLDNHAATNTLTAGGDPPETATITTRYQHPLNARLLDATGAPIEGASVTFALTAGSSGAGATFLSGSSQATALTDANGEAASPPLVANATPGSFSATANSAGISHPLAYSLRNLAATLHMRPAPGPATVAQRYHNRLSVRVTDTHGHPLDGVSVAFTVSAGSSGATAAFPGGSTQTTVASDSNGQATAPPLQANSIAGDLTASATIVNDPHSTHLIALSNRAGTPVTIATGAADGETTSTNSRFPVPLAVTASDKYGNPVAHATITFAAPVSGPSGRFRTRTQRPARVVRVTTDRTGIAVAPPLVANGIAGGFVVSATTGHAHAAFALITARS